MDTIYLAVEEGKWQALVNRLVNLHILYNVGNLLTEELCTTEHCSYKEPSKTLNTTLFPSKINVPYLNIIKTTYF
jgi:hypothetical protein